MLCLRRAREAPPSKSAGSRKTPIPVLESLPFGTESFETQVLPKGDMDDLAADLAVQPDSAPADPVVPSAPVVAQHDSSCLQPSNFEDVIETLLCCFAGSVLFLFWDPAQ